MSLSEVALSKLTKYKMIALTLEYQAKFDNTLLNINKELRELRNDLKKIQSCLSQKNVNSKLHKRAVVLARQCWGNSQYSRRECLEITGVPDRISNDDLETTTIKIFDKLNVAIDPSKLFFY